MNAILFLLFFAVWAAGMGSYVYFAHHVAPSALRNWSEEQGYTILETRMAGPLDWLVNSKRSGHQLYRIVAVDGKGERHSGLAVVGKPYWYCLSPDTCPVEVQWDSPAAAERHSRPVAPLTVFCFAAVDLALAFVLLLVLLVVLGAIALALDELRDGAWGLNHRLGRMPHPGGREETRMFLLQMLGFFAAYSAACVALAAGGVGMLRRRLWGYHAHLAGSVLVVFTGFGMLYAIPSLLITFRPAFKAYFSGDDKIKSAENPFADL